MFSLVFQYIQWHYTRGIVDLVNIILNFLWFVYNFFSIPILLKTLFVPFHRLQEKAKSVMQIEKWAEAMLVTFLMRLVGVVLRLILIFMAVVLLLLVFVVGVATLVVWLGMPLVVVGLIMFGMMLIGFA